MLTVPAPSLLARLSRAADLAPSSGTAALLGELGHDELVGLVNHLLKDPVALHQLAQRAYVRANGFTRLPLCTAAAGARVRLHYWPTAVLAEENIHDHRWGFVSRVLCGRLECVGSVVQLRLIHTRTDAEERRTFEIVGHGESDRTGARIAYDVPLVRAILGREVGFIVDVHLPKGEYEVEVMALLPSAADAPLGIVRV